MRRGLITLAAGALAGLGATLVPSSATAAPGGGGGGVGSGGSSDGVITASVTYTSEGGPSGPGSGCTFRLVNGDLSIENLGTVSWPRTGPDGETYHLWQRICPSGRLTWLEFPEREPRDLLPQLLTRLRERELPAPAPVFEALDPLHGWAYVRVPLDFRAGGDAWRTVSASASIGPLWATVTARPARLTFDPGDPNGAGAMSCGGDHPLAPYVPEVPGECSYTYTNASSTSPFDGYHFESTLTIVWEVSWTSSTGDGGPLAGLSTSASELLAVAEVQGLVTCTGSRPESGGC